MATVMITGDHVRTAFSIAKNLGIADDISQVVSGDEFDAMTPRERNKAIKKYRVFARVSPKHKNVIVEALKKSGEVVTELFENRLFSALTGGRVIMSASSFSIPSASTGKLSVIRLSQSSCVDSRKSYLKNASEAISIASTSARFVDRKN